MAAVDAGESPMELFPPLPSTAFPVLPVDVRRALVAHALIPLQGVQLNEILPPFSEGESSELASCLGHEQFHGLPTAFRESLVDYVRRLRDALRTNAFLMDPPEVKKSEAAAATAAAESIECIEIPGRCPFLVINSCGSRSGGEAPPLILLSSAGSFALNNDLDHASQREFDALCKELYMGFGNASMLGVAMRRGNPVSLTNAETVTRRLDPANILKLRRNWYYKLSTIVLDFAYGDLRRPERQAEQERLRELMENEKAAFALSRHSGGEVAGVFRALYDVELDEERRKFSFPAEKWDDDSRSPLVRSPLLAINYDDFSTDTASSSADLLGISAAFDRAAADIAESQSQKSQRQAEFRRTVGEERQARAFKRLRAVQRRELDGSGPPKKRYFSFHRDTGNSQRCVQRSTYGGTWERNAGAVRFLLAESWCLRLMVRSRVSLLFSAHLLFHAAERARSGQRISCIEFECKDAADVMLQGRDPFGDRPPTSLTCDWSNLVKSDEDNILPPRSKSSRPSILSDAGSESRR
jgi:hypothetical protein